MPLAVYSALALRETTVLIQTPSFGIKREETVTKTLDRCIREPCSFLYGKARPLFLLNLHVKPQNHSCVYSQLMCEEKTTTHTPCVLRRD